MGIYGPELTLRDAREEYFMVNGFGWGGYDDKWVRVEYGLLRFYFPNTEGRKKVVKHHDVHHILTGYGTSLSGEAEIGAWEVGTGCTRSVTAWMLNLSGFAWGLFTCPKAVYSAFLRGRRSANLYHLPLDDHLLAATVGELRHQLQLEKPSRPTSHADKLAFVAWSALSVAALLAIVATLIAPVVLILSAAWWLAR